MIRILFALAGSIPVRIGAVLLLLVLALLCVVGCQRGLVARTVDTHWVKTAGLEKEGQVYFLVSYRLKKPDRVIFPLYATWPGRVFVNNMYLYAYSLQDRSLSRLYSLLPTPGWHSLASPTTYWGLDEDTIYFAYQTNFSVEDNSYIYAVHAYGDGRCKALDLVTEEELKTITGNAILTREPATGLTAFEIDELTQAIAFPYWQLASPLTFSNLSLAEAKQVLIKAMGDEYFQESMFSRLQEQYSSGEMLALAEAIANHYESLEGLKRANYACHYMVWQARTWLHGKYGGASGERDDGLMAHLYRRENRQAMDLLATRQDLNAGDSAGVSPLMVAAYSNNTSMVQELIDRHVGLDQTDALGRTALMYAIFGRSADTMEQLITQGADTKIKDKEGKIAWIYAAASPLRRRYLRLTQD